MCIAVPPDDVAADHGCLLPVAGVIGAVESEVAECLELGLDPVEPGGVGRRVGQFDVVGLGPLGHPLIVLRRQVRAEVVQHNGDSDLGRVKGSEVAHEGQELGPALLRGDVPVEAVGCEVVAGHEVSYPVRPGVGGSPAATAGWALAAASGSDRGPLLARVGLEVEGAELVEADHDSGVRFPRLGGAIGDGVQLEDPVLLGLEVRIVALLPGLDHLKRHALLSEQDPEALMADVVDHPLGDQELCQLGQAPGREGQVVVLRTGERHLLDGLALGESELGRASAGVLRGQGVEPVGVEVVDHLSDPVLRGEGDPGDGRDVHGLGGPQHDLGSSPSDHRSRTSSHDAEQLVALDTGEVPYTHTFGHHPSLRDLVDAPPSTLAVTALVGLMTARRLRGAAVLRRLLDRGVRTVIASRLPV